LAGAFAPLSLSDAPRAISEEGIVYSSRPIYTEDDPGVVLHGQGYLGGGLGTRAELSEAIKQTKDYAWPLLACPRCRRAFKQLVISRPFAFHVD